MSRSCVFAAAAALAAATAYPVEWTNVDEIHYVSGRKCSEGYLQGKVVLVCKDAALAGKMEEIWKSFKTKQFVLLGSLQDAPENATFPVYSDCALTSGEPDAPLYVVDETGRICYRGKEERRATEALVMAITDMDSPRTLAQWKRFLAFEIMTLPGRGYRRYNEFKKKFPKETVDFEAVYAEVAKIPDIKKLAEFVQFAKEAKDVRAFDTKKAMMQKSRFESKVKSALSRYASLRESKDPRVVQEAKNAFADLKWTLAAL